MVKVLCLLFITFVLSSCNGGGGGGDANSGGGSSGGSTVLLKLDDPLKQYAWHLNNTGQSAFATNPGVAGEDLGLDQVYKDGIYGNGVKVVVSDGRIDLSHEDLFLNTNSSLSKNYSLSSPYFGNPTSSDDSSYANHGTSVMGIIGAVADNGIGSHGIAPKATLIGFNYLAGTYGNVAQKIDQANLSTADIYNYSYGSDTCFFEKDHQSYYDQLKYGTSTFRNGKGAIYVTSAGNDFIGISAGWCPSSPYNIYVGNSNLQQFKSYPYVITVASTTASGVASSYSVLGSNIWISGTGGEYGSSYPTILTTDLQGCSSGASKSSATQNSFENNSNGLNTNCNYTSTMSGTSSASPSVAGVVALMLEANPNLTWRDVKLILASTADRVDPYTGYLTHPLGTGNDLTGHEYQKLWIKNGANYWFNNKYGFGRVNADAAVNMAKNYTTNLGTLKTTYNSNSSEWYYKSGTVNLSMMT
jgi:subtilisin family serine protease